MGKTTIGIYTRSFLGVNDRKVKGIVRDLYKLSPKLLPEHRPALESLAVQILVTRELRKRLQDKGLTTENFVKATNSLRGMLNSINRLLKELGLTPGSLYELDKKTPHETPLEKQMRESAEDAKKEDERSRGDSSATQAQGITEKVANEGYTP